MSDLQKLQDFAATHNFGLTNPLRHAQVVQLAEYWFPEIRFFQSEKFHPISLDEGISMVEDVFGSLLPDAQDELRVNKLVRQGSNSAVLRTFDPPVVHVPDGVVQSGVVPVVRVINERSSASEALADSAVDDDAVITHGASFTRSNQFFGATTTLSGTPEPAAGDPFLPRATGEEGEPQITVMASLLNLFELLKYELLASEEGDEYPPDGMRGGFDIARTLVQPISGPSSVLPFPVLRRFLLDTIASIESGGAIPAPPVPLGFQLNRSAWNAVKRFAFLEYEFFYAFNDFNRHEKALFANEHEGDVEGCCLVFDRSLLNLAATVNDSTALFRAVPHSIITSVHEENQDADIFSFIDPPIVTSPDRLARDDVTFTVYPAAGSHATYLTADTHDLVDFQDYTAFIEENPAVLLLGGTLVALLSWLAILECFTDTEDETSDDGVRTGPEEVVGLHPAAVGNRLIVLPMSTDNHIYEAVNEELLRLRSFAGKWGGHASFIDKSPVFKSRTGRYFRRLLSQIS